MLFEHLIPNLVCLCCAILHFSGKAFGGYGRGSVMNTPVSTD